MKHWLSVSATLLTLASTTNAFAQYPQPTQPTQPYPTQPQPQQPYGQPTQPYPYGQPTQPGYNPQYPYGVPAAQQPKQTTRGGGEMIYLLGTSAAYGIGTGVWIDALAETKDPGIAVVAPITIGAAVPVGLFLWDNYSKMGRGVPSSMATGILLGALEGMGASGMQSSLSSNGWSFKGHSTLTFLTATVGGIGGYFFGDYYRPDPRNLSFIASGSGMGAIAGMAFGAGSTPRRTDGTTAQASDYVAVGGFVGFNSGMLATGALSIAGVTPSYQTQKYMWVGFGAGAAVTSVVYIFYLFGDRPEVWHGLIANGLGAIAGAALGGIMSADLKDDVTAKKTFAPPFFLGAGPVPGGGGMLSAYGTF